MGAGTLRSAVSAAAQRLHGVQEVTSRQDRGSATARRRGAKALLGEELGHRQCRQRGQVLLAKVAARFSCLLALQDQCVAASAWWAPVRPVELPLIAEERAPELRCAAPLHARKVSVRPGSNGDRTAGGGDPSGCGMIGIMLSVTLRRRDQRP